MRGRSIGRLIGGFAVFMALAIVLPDAAAGQTRADSAAVLLDAARRLEADRENAAAAALYEMILVRFGDTPAAELVRAGRATGGINVLDRRGRTELYVWSTTYGAWLGIALPLAMSADSPEAYGLGLLAGAPAGFFAARAYMRGRAVSEGQARAITWGGTWGTIQGAGWVQALDIGIERATSCVQDVPCDDSFEEDSGEEVVTGMILGGLAGVTTGAILAKKPITAGTAATVSLGSLWGSAYGLSLGYLAGIEEDALLTTTLLAGNAALLATAIGQRTWRLSESRARLISVAGLAGALAGGGLDLIMQPNDEKLAVAIPVATGTAGLIFGWARTRDMDSDRGTREQDGDLGALIQVRDGRLGMSTPAIRPHFERRDGNTGQPGVYLPVFSARF